MQLAEVNLISLFHVLFPGATDTGFSCCHIEAQALCDFFDDVLVMVMKEYDDLSGVVEVVATAIGDCNSGSGGGSGGDEDLHTCKTR